MIEKFKQFRFEFDKQKEEYSKIKGDITEENKYVLLDEINKESIWNYFQLSIEILFDLASDSEKYLEYLDSVFLKVKGDMASGPFFEMLIKVGKEKQEVAIKLYYIIQNKSNNIDLKIISGLILGGYSFYNEGLLKDLIKRNLEYPTKNTILKAILVKYEKEILPTEVKECLNKTMLSHDERILTELMNLYLSFYKNEKSYFYEKIKSLAERKIISVNRLLFWKTIGIKLDKEHILELIELYKNSEETIINDMMYPLIDYPDEIEKISKLFIYWINKDLEFKVQHFDWAIQELVKKNEKFIDYFLDNFEKVKTEKLDYKYIFPRIFEKMASQNVEFASRELMEKKIFDKDPKLYNEIDESLKEFSELDKIIKHKLKELYNKKRYSPLFWLGSQQRDKELKKAYLNEIENFLSYSKNISNERNKDNRTSLIRGLENEDKFWDDFSEIIFTNKFIFLEENLNSILEPKIPNKNNNADLYIKLNNKNDKILKEKSSQFYSLESFEEMKKGIRNDLYFIVVDASSSVIDEYMIANSFFGTLTYQFYRNNETGETTKPELIRKDDAIAKDKQIVSGLIYFKKQLVNLDGKVKFILVGDIILNPYAVNQPTVEEIKKLKEIIF